MMRRPASLQVVWFISHLSSNSGKLFFLLQLWCWWGPEITDFLQANNDTSVELWKSAMTLFLLIYAVRGNEGFTESCSAWSLSVISANAYLTVTCIQIRVLVCRCETTNVTVVEMNWKIYNHLSSGFLFQGTDIYFVVFIHFNLR